MVLLKGNICIFCVAAFHICVVGSFCNMYMREAITLTGEICFSQIAPRRGRPSLEALACVGNIAKAMGPTMDPHIRALLDPMFSAGLSMTLVFSLELITERFSLSLNRTFMNWFFCEVLLKGNMCIFCVSAFHLCCRSFRIGCLNVSQQSFQDLIMQCQDNQLL